MKTIASVASFLIALFILVGCKTKDLNHSNPASDIDFVKPVELFNGTNFDGWTFCMKTNADPMQTWTVRDGVIHCTGQPYGYARTTQAYDNYKLAVVWRFVKVAPHADNSGIFVHIRPPDAVWPECIECQGEYQHQGDFHLHAGVTADGHPLSTKSTRVPQLGPQNENPAGEWGTNQIVCDDGDIQLYVNGKLMNQVTGCNLTNGFVGIQSEGGEIEVKRLTLEPLK